MGSTPVAYPPLHMHHIHIEREVPHFFETHGDYTMDPVKGYHNQLPVGHCVVYDDELGRGKLKITAHVNDVRTFMRDGTAMASSQHTAETIQDAVRQARAKLQPFKWYLRVAFQLAPPYHAYAVQLIPTSPGPSHASSVAAPLHVHPLLCSALALACSDRTV